VKSAARRDDYIRFSRIEVWQHTLWRIFDAERKNPAGNRRGESKGDRKEAPSKGERRAYSAPSERAWQDNEKARQRR